MPQHPAIHGGRVDHATIAEAVVLLQTALARDRLGEYQAQAAIAALHADARTVGETDWVPIVQWYDELAGPGLAALDGVDPAVPRYTAVVAHLQEKAGDLALASRLYGEAACAATTVAERDHLTLQSARLHQALRDDPPNEHRPG